MFLHIFSLTMFHISALETTSAKFENLTALNWNKLVIWNGMKKNSVPMRNFTCIINIIHCLYNLVCVGIN